MFFIFISLVTGAYKTLFKVGRQKTWTQVERVKLTGDFRMFQHASDSRGLQPASWYNYHWHPCISSVCPDKIPWMRWRNRNLFLTVLETRMSPWWSEGPLRAADLPLYPCTVEGARELSGASFSRALKPSMRAPPSGLNHLPKPHLLIPSSPWARGLQHVNLSGWGGAQTFESQLVYKGLSERSFKSSQFIHGHN